MKKTTKYIAFLLGGIALTCFAACSDDEWAAGPTADQDCISAAFKGKNVAFVELEDTEPTEITLTVTRDKTDAAAAVAIEVLNNTDNVFSIPESVNFAAGEATSDLTISFDNAELKEEYTFEIALDEAAVNPYKGNGYACYTIQRLKWVTIPGTFTFSDWTFTEYNGGKKYDVTVQRVDGENRYRIVDPFKEATKDYSDGEAKDGVTVDEADEFLTFKINPTNKGVTFDSYFTGYIDKDNSAILGLCTEDQMGVADVDSKYNDSKKEITFNVYYYADNEDPKKAHLIGQKEAILTVPTDFAVIPAKEQ